MFEFFFLLSALLGLIASAIALGHVKAKAQSVLIHHATHNNLLPHKGLNRAAAQLVGVMTLNADFDSYRQGADRESGHIGHHSKRFASLDDEESQFVWAEGFKPGMSRQALWRQHWKTLFGPGFHARQAVKRLRLNFLGGSARRRAVAWAYWGAVLLGAAWAGLLLPLLLTLLLGLFLVGQAASWYEQATRHLWLVSTPESGRARHAALSHGRFLGAMPPQVGGVRPWLRFAGQTLAALAGRVLVVQADLPHHPHHHRGLDLQVVTGMVSWTDSARAQSPMLWVDPKIQEPAYTRLHDAIDAWFVALSKEQPVSMPA
jgi:hypothetical protein